MDNTTPWRTCFSNCVHKALLWISLWHFIVELSLIVALDPRDMKTSLMENSYLWSMLKRNISLIPLCCPMCTGWSYGERNFFRWWLFKSKICLQDYFSPSLFPQNKGRAKINPVVLMPEDFLACLFSLSWFVPSKSVIYGQLSTSFHTRVVKSAVPPCSSDWNQNAYFLGSKWGHPRLWLRMKSLLCF